MVLIGDNSHSLAYVALRATTHRSAGQHIGGAVHIGYYGDSARRDRAHTHHTTEQNEVDATNHRSDGILRILWQISRREEVENSASVSLGVE